MAGLSFKEIAELTGLSESTIRTHYSNAMQKIRHRLTEDEEFANFMNMLNDASRQEASIPNETLEEIMLRLEEDHGTILDEFPDEPTMADIEAQVEWARENLSADEYYEFFRES